MVEYIELNMKDFKKIMKSANKGGLSNDFLKNKSFMITEYGEYNKRLNRLRGKKNERKIRNKG